MLSYGRSLLLLIVQQIHLVEQSEVVDVVINTQQLLVVDVLAHQCQVDVRARAEVAFARDPKSITLRTLGCRRNTERRSFIVQSLSPNSFSVVIGLLYPSLDP